MNHTTVNAGEDDRTTARPDGPPPVTFNLDPEARAVRAVLGLLVLFVVLLPAGIVARSFGDEYAGFAGFALAGSVCVYLALLIVAFLAPRPSDGDGLCLDLNGLTLIRAGNRRHWPWSDLGDFTIATRSRLFGLFLGRRILIRIPAVPRSTTTPDGDHREPTTVCIAGEHLVTDDDIVEALSAFRDHEAGHSTRDELRARIPGGTYFPRDQHGRTAKTQAVMISSFVYFMSLFGTASVVGGLFDGWQVFVSYWTDPLSHWFILTAATLFGLYDIYFGLRKLMAALNHVEIDTGGLLLAADGRRRRWRWDAVSVPEIEEVPESDGAPRRCIVFIARHDGFTSGPQETPGLLPAALRFTIEDIYEAPLETMLGQMTESRANARSKTEATVAIVPGTMPIPT